MTDQDRFIEANGIRFHLVERGTGPLVLMLHGFPEFWYSWRKQLPILSDAGYRAVALDMRGYNLTDKPESGYDIETLVEDVGSVIHELGEDRAHLVGHDWGGIVAWQTAWRRPELLRSLVVMNAPHPSAFAGYVRRNPLQMLKSSYVMFFQVPGLAEWTLTSWRAAAIGAAFRNSARQQGAITDTDIKQYREAFLRPGVARAALSYYRNAVREGTSVLPTTPITVPTLVLWGQDDPVLQEAANDRLSDWVDPLTYGPIRGCGHWTQQERPELVNAELLAWLEKHA